MSLGEQECRLDEPAEIEVPDPDSPHGPWMLGRNSWHIHRAFYRKAGRPMHHGEYSDFRRQIKAGEAVTLAPGVYRVTARCGRGLIIRFDGRLITALLAEDWSVEADAERRRQRAAQRASARPAPPPPEPVAPPVEAVAAVPAPPPPPPLSPPPARTPSLTLTSTAAADALAVRLQRQGITPAPPAPKPAATARPTAAKRR